MTRYSLYFVVAIGTLTNAPTFAISIPANLLTNALRPSMLNEGYLAYSFNPETGNFGEEYTGWIDIRHPANNGTTNTKLGFDRSDRFVTIKTITTSDNMGIPAHPQIARDFDFTNKIYAQAGVSVIRTEQGTIALNGTAGSPNVRWPINQDDQDNAMKALNRSPDTKTINDYYVQQYDGSHPNGLTSPPYGYGGNAPRNDGSGIADAARSSTFAHELGHMLLNADSAFSSNNCPGNEASESCTPSNFMYRSGSDFTLNDVSRTKGVMEGAQIDRIFEDGGANNPGFVRKDHHDAAGDHIDWDFVANQVNLEERLHGADNHNVYDSLFWGIGPTVDPVHISTDGTFSDIHQHTGLGVFPATPDFSGQTFRLLDVFSLSTRYSDFNLNAAQDNPPQESALDYDLWFRGANGELEHGNLIKVFEPGWNQNTNADNYLARWSSPIDATGVFIFAGTGSDGTTQIDGIIAANNGIDFGDAPDSYKTLLSSDGPRYSEGDYQRLGRNWDAEPNGQPTPWANGDDNNLWGVGGPDDEDGVIFGDSWVDVLIDVTRPGFNEYSLRAWWDLNENGIFDHLSELFINDILDFGPGSYWRHYDLSFNPKDYYSRFRLTWLDDPLGLIGGVSRMTDITPHGEFLSADGFSHGEVEDYVPEPGTFALLGAGAFAFSFVNLQRKLNRRRKD